MKTTKYLETGLCLFAITASGLAFADCPNAMPVKLLQDCITYEGAGESFPTDDYAYLGQYKEWLKTQAQPGLPVVVKKGIQALPE
jgi:hypothetical protein